MQHLSKENVVHLWQVDDALILPVFELLLQVSVSHAGEIMFIASTRLDLGRGNLHKSNSPNTSAKMAEKMQPFWLLPQIKEMEHACLHVSLAPVIQNKWLHTLFSLMHVLSIYHWVPYCSVNHFYTFVNMYHCAGFFSRMAWIQAFRLIAILLPFKHLTTLLLDGTHAAHHTMYMWLFITHMHCLCNN